MTRSPRGRRALMLAVILNVLVQLSLLFALALSDEWRVWRFLTDVVAMLDAVLVLAWFALRWKRADQSTESA